MNSYIELAYKAAANSTHRVHHMAAVVFRGGSVLAVAHNTHKRYTCCERRALRPHLDMQGATIVIVRSNRGMSKPCLSCQQIIRQAGIKKVVYFDWNGNLVIEKASQLN